MAKYARKKHLKECVICGGDFYASNRGKITRKFCSSECRYSENKLTFSCHTCGEKVIRTKGNVKNKVYCSKECSDIGKIGVSINKVNKVELKCKFCNKLFEKLPCHSDYKFCSKECSSKFKYMGLPELTLRAHWEHQRVVAKERDNYKCVKCGMCDDEHIERFGRGLNVHHKIPYIYFKEDNEDQHSLGNLETVCTPCHREIHTKELNPLKYDRSKIRCL